VEGEVCLETDEGGSVNLIFGSDGTPWGTAWYDAEFILRNQEDNSRSTAMSWFDVRPFETWAWSNTWDVKATENVSLSIEVMDPSTWQAMPGQYNISAVYENRYGGMGPPQRTQLTNFSPTSFTIAQAECPYGQVMCGTTCETPACNSDADCTTNCIYQETCAAVCFENIPAGPLSSCIVNGSGDRWWNGSDCLDSWEAQQVGILNCSGYRWGSACDDADDETTDLCINSSVSPTEILKFTREPSSHLDSINSKISG